jgi:TolB-like protein
VHVVYGSVGGYGSSENLTVTVAEVDDGTVLWTQSYPSTAADPVKIAAEVDSKVPSPEDD